MSTFDKREDAFEAKFAHDESLKFKAHARRNRALGLWAAGKLGLSSEEATTYAQSLIEADLEQAGDEEIYAKLKADFDAKGLDISEHRIRRTMEDLLSEALASIKAER
ncbi:DUF1476 domain-containing protein [Ancylobacter defluvii]|uniref:DUF1476 domain-containing protein n=1 Tax=Ancylobacter defluvii TaxID=1282440 RepID=A0A9W6K2E7_9HYPH|nr:DUF1476 domain-containing protein [Ancylobacter defluvii]MBS7586934.1 DUF1476 domain-containing protein [Ancylobacter defluvii]GLK86239.1 hypothetical protein GCM10017653_43090 [Ancylobacter defluvii]